MKKKISLLLACFLTLTAAACGGPSDTSSSDGDSQGGPVYGTIAEGEEHPFTGGLHKIDVTEGKNVFVENGKTDYVVVLPEAADSGQAAGAAQIQKHLKAATGAEINVVSDENLSYDDASEYIVIGSKKLFDAAGLTMPEDDIGDCGYYIKSDGNSVFIMANRDYGSKYGAIEFLWYAIGYECLYGDSVSYGIEKGEKVVMPEFDVIEAPDITYNTPSNKIDSATATGLRVNNSGDIFMGVNGATIHNSLAYLPVDTYAEKYPEWYSQDRRELCYTAHGDPDLYELMIEKASEVAISVVDANPSKTTIALTVMDGGYYCTCDACTESKEKYNGADSAAVIKFINRISANIDAHLAEQAAENEEPREVTMLFFAYNQTTNPPVKEENGEYAALDDSVVCGEHVGVYIAPITAQWNHSLYAEANEVSADAIRGWSAICKNMYFWLYDTNFSYYLYPFNSWDSIIETYRFCAENNGYFMYNEGQYNNGGQTGFTTFKEYINAKARWNVNVNFNDLKDRFFTGYFREAAEPMEKYFDELTSYIRWLEAEYPAGVNGNIYHNAEKSEYWPKRTLEHWLGYIEEAYKSVEIYKESDPLLYSRLIGNIKLESIFPRYALLTLYSGTFDNLTLTEERKQFKADCNELNVTRFREGGELSTTFSTWGI